jgi:hypothetical protein
MPWWDCPLGFKAAGLSTLLSGISINPACQGGASWTLLRACAGLAAKANRPMQSQAMQSAWIAASGMKAGWKFELWCTHACIRPHRARGPLVALWAPAVQSCMSNWRQAGGSGTHASDIPVHHEAAALYCQHVALQLPPSHHLSCRVEMRCVHLKRVTHRWQPRPHTRDTRTDDTTASRRHDACGFTSHRATISRAAL